MGLAHASKLRTHCGHTAAEPVVVPERCGSHDVKRVGSTHFLPLPGMRLVRRNGCSTSHPPPLTQPATTAADAAVVVLLLLCCCCCWCVRLIHYPPAYVPLTGERGSFSLLDVTPEDSRAFYGTHPPARQVRRGGGHHLRSTVLVCSSMLATVQCSLVSQGRNTQESLVRLPTPSSCVWWPPPLCFARP